MPMHEHTPGSEAIHLAQNSQKNMQHGDANSSNMGKVDGTVISFDSETIDMKLQIPSLSPVEDSTNQNYVNFALPVLGYLIACPRLCGNYALVTPNGTHCPRCAFREFPFLQRCPICGGMAAIAGKDLRVCKECGEYVGNSEGHVSRGNRLTERQDEAMA